MRSDSLNYAALFHELVSQNRQVCRYALGLDVNPISQNKEVDLILAKTIIDLLEMLKVKTLNNLTPKEVVYLDESLSELKSYYVNQITKN